MFVNLFSKLSFSSLEVVDHSSRLGEADMNFNQLLLSRPGDMKFISNLAMFSFPQLGTLFDGKTFTIHRTEKAELWVVPRQQKENIPDQFLLRVFVTRELVGRLTDGPYLWNNRDATSRVL